MIRSPLHALWEGKGAVYIFFVLSGIVLTLPAVKARQAGNTDYSWRAFYPVTFLVVPKRVRIGVVGLSVPA